MVDFNEMFGTTPAEVFENEQTSLGYMAGTTAAQKIHDLFKTEFSGNTREWREAMLEGLRENL